MGIVRVIAFAAAALLALSAAAGAADMPEIVQQPATVLQQLGSTWYLRGDISYRLQTPASADWGGLAVTDPSIDGALGFGGGIGIKMGWLRIDATADFAFPATLQGNVPGVASFSGTVDSVVVLANAYADLGTWYGFTPYIGGGVGTAGVRTSSVSSTFVQSSAGMVGVDRWNVAWALMAGVGYNVTPSLLIDLGYRYLHLGDVATTADQFGNALAVRAVSANEVRLGVRYTIE
jgi:opacity protein-like surface antigen